MLRALCWVVLVLPTFAFATGAGSPPMTQTFHELGYGDRTARALHGSLEYYLPLPPGRVPGRGSALELAFGHSPLLEPALSSMTVVVNGTSLSSVRLGPQNLEAGRLEVPIPAMDQLAPAPAGLFVQLRFRLRVTQNDCEDEHDPAQWASVSGDSRLRLLPVPPVRGLLLADAPRYFLPDAKRALPVAMTLPERPAAEELLAAGLVALELGRWAAESGVDPQLQLTRTPFSGQPTLIIATSAQLDAGTPGESPAPGGHGTLALATTPGPTLVISGPTSAAVLEAAQLLVRPAARRLLSASRATAGDGKLAPAPPPAPWREGAASFAQLGFERQQVVGEGEHSLTLSVDRPASWNLLTGSYLELVVTSAPGLRRDTSFIAASVNGHDLGARPLALTPDGSPQRLRFALPEDILNADLAGKPLRRLALEVRFLLDSPSERCMQKPAESLWAAVLPSSAWHLPHEEVRGLDLARFPEMLGSGEAELVVVVPSPAGEADLEAALRLMAAIGRLSGARGPRTARLVSGEAVEDSSLGTANLVLLGAPSRNPVSRRASEMNPDLFARTPAAARPSAPSRSGFLRVDRSPWSAARWVLVMDGDEPGGIGLAPLPFTDRRGLALLTGSAAELWEELSPQPVREGTPGVSPPSSLNPRVVLAPVDRLENWQLVGAILLGAFLSAVAAILFVRYRIGRPG